jgi:epoxyqueuosine reductase
VSTAVTSTMRNKSIFAKLLAKGFRIRVVSTSHLPELQAEMENRQTQGELDAEFSKTYLSRFKFTLPDELTNANSLIVVAMPRPPTKATFARNGKKQSFILPPTYTAYDEKRIEVEDLVANAVGGEGYKVATPYLPLKLLATRSGLAQYGRNNITYVDGMGSFQRLTAVYSDMPCLEDEWQQTKMMKRCENCDLCRKACPTGAISSDRFLLRAEKCITYHNEKKGSIPFPDWIKPSWHNCIIGCLTCQRACPENKPFLSQIGEMAEFSEEETRLLLKGTSKEQLSDATIKKMKLLSLTDYFEELPRNLSVLLK